jgi:hypothetical protein
MASTPTNSEETNGSDYDEDNNMTLRAKWMLDGCRTLYEVVQRLQEEVEYIKQLHQDGWELTSAIEDDWGFLKRLKNED